ncbi:MAG: hypothetical protein OXR73_18425 [Myxococcales bacterium]|nr:hypothetical protein [Myxococcales bacterium]
MDSSSWSRWSTEWTEDYLCARMPGLPSGQGACVPPYFLGQLRVDGHGFVFADGK